jgi:hypothetical protein
MERVREALKIPNVLRDSRPAEADGAWQLMPEVVRSHGRCG